MIPKEKSIHLVKRYSCLHHGIDENLLENVVVSDYAIESALIAVDEILNELFEITLVTGSSYVHKHIDYYKEVKNEINKL
jgi:hypothetical protein